MEATRESRERGQSTNGPSKGDLIAPARWRLYRGNTTRSVCELFRDDAIVENRCSSS